MCTLLFQCCAVSLHESCTLFAEKRFDVRFKIKRKIKGQNLDKGHPTARAGTHEGLLPSVQSSVVVQSVPFCELALTELAGILLDASVHVHVILETGNPVEPLAALLANKWFDVGMFHRV